MSTKNKPTTKTPTKPFNFMSDDANMRKAFNRSKELSYVIGIFTFALLYNFVNITTHAQAMFMWGGLILFANLIIVAVLMTSYNSLRKRLRNITRDKEINEVDVRNAILTGVATGFGVPLVISLIYARKGIWWIIAIGIVLTLFLTERSFDKKFGAQGFKNAMLITILSTTMFFITLNVGQIAQLLFKDKPKSPSTKSQVQSQKKSELQSELQSEIQKKDKIIKILQEEYVKQLNRTK